ncbi:DUF1488 family protein [Rheinheimera baltica]|uniref:DUF1488 family protein n=1 Tax=Rheinheimera baltica TaxID=67576 RepID=A0ABT9HXF4_9GAMM|nr:DUF1488 family protein [Rheinheimera baltica]MDP5135804.1 DUF1488 family protein [Rheinheimera baltica]MDP5143797.1 DUF1488 family protein [Rheinheimera baltica]
MNQQLIFNSDFYYDVAKQAVAFTCLVSGLRVNCFIRLPQNVSGDKFLQQVKADAFNWEDSAEHAIANDAYNSVGEIWL